MPWNAILADDGRRIETTYTGHVNPAELQASFEAMVALVREAGHGRILADTTLMEGGHSVIDLYFLADAILATGLGPKIREAMLMPSLPDTAEKVRFWETTCANRGLNVRIFTDRGEALAWLHAA